MADNILAETMVGFIIFLVGVVALYVSHKRDAVMWSIMACVLFIANILYVASIPFASPTASGVFVGSTANIMLIGLNLIFTTYALIRSVYLSFQLFRGK